MENIKWTEKEVGIDELKPNENNPRRISKEQFDRLKKSIQETGYHARCICDSSLNLLGGHMRLRAMKALGVKRVSVLIPSRELTDEEKKRISIQDNIGFGEWDFDALGNQFDTETLKDWGMPAEWLPDEIGLDAEPADEKKEKTPCVCPKCGHILGSD